MSVLDSFRLDGRTAVVTGAGRGLGERTAIGLAEAGADVAIADIDADNGAEAAAAIADATGVETTSLPRCPDTGHPPPTRRTRPTAGLRRLP